MWQIFVSQSKECLFICWKTFQRQMLFLKEGDAKRSIKSKSNTFCEPIFVAFLIGWYYICEGLQVWRNHQHSAMSLTLLYIIFYSILFGNKSGWRKVSRPKYWLLSKEITENRLRCASGPVLHFSSVTCIIESYPRI